VEKLRKKRDYFDVFRRFKLGFGWALNWRRSDEPCQLWPTTNLRGPLSSALAVLFLFQCTGKSWSNNIII